MAVLVANANANMSNEVMNHIVSVLPEIAKFAGFSDVSIDVDKFLSSKTFCGLASSNLTPEPPLMDSQAQVEPVPTLITTEVEPEAIDVAIEKEITRSITRSESVLSRTMRSIGIDPQLVLDRFATPGRILTRISSQYQDQLELILEGIKEEGLVGDAMHDDTGLMPASLFRQPSWREKLQKKSGVSTMRKSQSQSSFRSLKPFVIPRLRFHTT